MSDEIWSENVSRSGTQSKFNDGIKAYSRLVHTIG